MTDSLKTIAVYSVRKPDFEKDFAFSFNTDEEKEVASRRILELAKDHGDLYHPEKEMVDSFVEDQLEAVGKAVNVEHRNALLESIENAKSALEVSTNIQRVFRGEDPYELVEARGSQSVDEWRDLMEKLSVGVKLGGASEGFFFTDEGWFHKIPVETVLESAIAQAGGLSVIFLTVDAELN